MSVITFDQITPAWLTGVLERSGWLATGRVMHVEQERNPSPTAHNAALRLSWSPEARWQSPAGGAAVVPPERLFFKHNRETVEARFYRRIAPRLARPRLLTCYDAQYDDSGSHLLLEHVGETHFAPPDAAPMPLASHEAVIDALADVHSQFWEHNQLRDEIGALAEDIPAFMAAEAGKRFATFVDDLGDRLSARRRAALERILATFPRYRPSGPLTLVHGDAHWWNFLYPHDPPAHPLYLIDWAVWHVNSGASDLAYNIALQCYPERRARIEQPLVQRYHRRLLANGVQGYAWDRCWEDYRRLVIDHCLWPVLWHGWRLSPNIWWFALECTLSAFEDLECEAFL